MFSFSLVDAVNGELRRGLKDTQRLDAEDFSGAALRVIPTPENGLDVSLVKALRVSLTNGDGDPTTWTDTSAPFIFAELPALMAGATRFNVEALDEQGAVLPQGTGQLAFDVTEGSEEPELFTPLRIQAEDTDDIEADGNYTTLTGENLLPQGGEDEPNAINAEGGAYIDYGDPSGEALAFHVDIAEAGEYEIALRYALSQNSDGTDRNRPLRLELNGELIDRQFDLPSTTDTADNGDFTTFAERTLLLQLEAGQNIISFTSNGESGPNVDALEVRQPAEGSVVIQGENLALSPAQSLTDNTTNRVVTLDSIITIDDTFRIGAEGASYLDWAFGNADAYAEFGYEAPVAGTYRITVTYAGSTDRPLDLMRVENGETTVLDTFDFIASAAPESLPDDLDDIPEGVEVAEQPSEWEGWTTETLEIALGAGDHLLRLGGYANGPNIDKIEMALVAADPVPASLALDNASVLENDDGAVVGQLTIEGGAEAYVYSVDDDRFEVDDAGMLRLKEGVSLDFETEASVEVRVTATDSNEVSLTETFTLAVGDVEEETQATVLIGIADAAPLVESGDDGVTTLNFALSASENFSGEVALDLEIDGVAETRSVTFTDGSAMLAVDVANDDEDNGSETVSVSLIGVTGDNVDVDATAATASGSVSEDDEAPVEPVDPIRLQAEDFDSSLAFSVESMAAADGGQGIRLPARTEGSARYELDGKVAAGTYTVIVRYFDEDDGESTAQLSIGNAEGESFSGSWTFDDDGGGNGLQAQNLRTVTFENVTVGENAALDLSVTSDAFEYARIDYIEFVPGSIEPTPTALIGIADAAPQVESGDDGVTTLSFALSASENFSGEVALDLEIDGVAETRSVTFTDGSATLDVGVANDDEDNGTETVSVSLIGVTGDNVDVDVTAATASGSVSEDDEAPVEPVDPIRLQAEDFDSASAFSVESMAAADGGQGIRLPARTEGSARYELDGKVAAGTYTVIVRYFDEDDGESTAQLSIGNAEGESFSGSWTFDDDGGGNGLQAQNLRTVTFENVTVGENAALDLSVTSDAFEYARIDYIEFVPGSVEPTPTVLIGIADAAPLVESGDDGVTTLSFALSASENFSGEVTLDLEIDGMAETRSVSFTDGSAMLAVDVANDDEDNGTETVSVSLVGVTGDTVAIDATAATASGSVSEDDEATVFVPIVIQAENGDLTIFDDGSNTTVTTVRDADNPETGSGFSGLRPDFSGTGYVDYGDTAGDAVTFEVSVPQAGSYDLNIRYASNTGRPLDLSINGNDAGALPFTSTDPDGAGEEEGFDHWLFETVTVTLAAGSNSVSLAIPEGASTGPNIDRIEITEAGSGPLPEDPDGEPPVEVDPIVIQAENASLVAINDSGSPDEGAFTRVVDAANPDAFGNYREGAEGGAYVDFGSDPGDEVVFTVNAEVAGTYTATIRFGNGGADPRPLNLSVNGSDASQVAFPPAPDDGVTDPWDIWQEIEIEVELEAGANSVSFAIPSVAEGGVNNGPNFDWIKFDHQADDGGEPPVEPFLFEIEGEALTIHDDEPTPDTVVRDASNPETNTGAGPDGLWDGFGGEGYLDMGNETGDAASFEVTVEEAGTYTLTVRYANGDGAGASRPMDILVGGESQGSMGFPTTGIGDAGWLNWSEATIELDLEAGSNTIRLENLGNAGPNIDSLAVSREGDEEPPFVEPGERFAVKINFQPEGFATPEGYVADTGQAFGDQSVTAGGQTYQYGWVTEASIADGTDNGTTPLAIADLTNVAVNDRTDEIAGVDPRQGTYAHFDQPAANYVRAGWEIELEDGYYEVTLSIGDTSGPYDSVNAVNAEGEAFNDAFTPFRPDDFPEDGNPANDTEGFRSDLVTRVVLVTDGRLTLDSIGLGENTEIQYVEIKALPDLTPEDDREAPADYAFFTDPRAIAGVGENEVEVDLDAEDGTPPTGVDPNSDIFVGISVVDGRGGALLESLNDGSVRLFKTVSGQEVTFNVNTTGGFDSLTISPSGTLQEFTSYTLVIEGFQDRGPNDDPDAPTREFQKFTTTFVTGEAAEIVPREVAFNDVVEINGATDGAFQFTSLEISPDGSKMYVSDMLGQLKRYDIDPQTGALSNEQVLALDHFNGDSAGARGIIGLTFDPTDPNVIWVTDNYPIPLSGRDNGVPDFSGRITKITLDGGDAFSATAETYVTGLPRSNGDHVTNSLEFRANLAYDAQANPDVPSHLLYLVQGSNSAMGEIDSAWGNRPERLLNATVLEIDPTQEAPEGGFDVSTEPLPNDGLNRRFADNDNDLLNGPIEMGNGEYLVFAENGTATVQDVDGNVLEAYYDPFADDAVVKIFATGVRNAYDLVWHSNGSLYVPTNGSAAGGNVPDDPSTPQNEYQGNVEKQDDYLFTVEEGGYYGHPNPLRGEYILNGGNPTTGSDPNQVGNYPSGQQPDPNYDLEGAYSLGENRSPNGVTEYTSGVFGGNLQGSVLFTEYSGGDDIRYISLDANGNIVGDDVIRDVNGNVISYIDPLDVIENPATGQLYLLTLNRNNGQSQIIRLDPAPGGVITDPGEPGEPGDDLVSVLVIQAEDDTPNDGTSVAIAEGSGAEIEIRDASNPETTEGLEYGLRPGAYGTDGNNDNTDGVLGGYADFGATNADFLTFNFELSGSDAGESVLRVRYGNGANTDRPLEVFVNNVSVGVFAFSPPAGATGDDAWNEWMTLDIPADLVSGLNTVRFQATANTGPNIDQLEILKAPDDTTPGYTEYEAEAADLDGPVVVTADQDDRNASGEGFVDFDGTADQSITWTIEVDEAGTYEVGFRYALATTKADRPMMVSINGSDVGELNFPGVSGVEESDWYYQTTTVILSAGSNTVSVTAPGANGPNIDLLRVADTPEDTFEPSYADIDGSGRIELENGESARPVNERTADFYFTVSEDGAYKLDLAANAGASDGGNLTLLLNGQPLDQMGYPGVGDDGELSTYVELQAGIQYNLRVVSQADGANEIDYLDLSPAPGDPDADIGIESGDAAYFSDRLHFNYLENNSASNPDRDYKESGTVVISNTGTSELSFIDADVEGPFVLAQPTIFAGLTLGAGESIEVEVLFDREAYTPPANDAGDGVFEGRIRLVTNDADTPVAEVHLAGFWQARDEGGWEPNVNEVWEVFGFGNVIEGLSTQRGGENSVLNGFDLYRPVNDDEVLSRYWKLADGVESATITHIAAFHGGGGATLGIHNPNNKNADITLSNHAGDNNQSLLPILSNGGFATATITADMIPASWAGNGLFGIEVAGLSTDPSLNPTGGGTVPDDAEGIERGYTVRMFQALDANGNVIPNTYLGIMDYTGINYDYNDNMFVIEGVEPASGGEITIANLDGVPSDERLVMSRIENPANANQQVHDEVVFTITNDGFANLEIASLEIADPSLFEIVGESTDLVIPAGGSLNVTVRFIAQDTNTATLYESTLTINSNDGDEGQKVIQLAGLAQGQSESGQEPTVQDIVKAFGFSTDVAEGQMNQGGLVEANGDEILSPYFQRAEGSAPIKITQLAAYHTQGDVARLFIHDVDSRDLDEVLAHDEQDGQTLLPRTLNNGDLLTTTTLDRDDPFGFFAEISGRQGYISWSDPDANLYEDTIDAIGNPGTNLDWDQNDGHLIRVYVARDGSGEVIPNTYIVIQDYAGVNYDYNDNIFLLENVTTYDPTGAEDADGNGRVDIYDDDDGDGVPNFLDDQAPVQQTAYNDSDTPWVVGSDGLTLDAVNYDEGGQDVAYNDSSANQEGSDFRGDGVDIVGDGDAIGWIENGEWVEYTIEVAESGTYELSFLTALGAQNGSARSITASFAQGDTAYATASPVAVGYTGGWSTFTQTDTVQVELEAGVQVVRLTFNGGSQDLASFSLAPVETNSAPEVDNGLNDLTATQDEAFSYTIPAEAFSDADGDALSYTASGLPAGLTLSPTGVISGTPTANGSFEVLVTASDGEDSVETGFTLTIEAPVVVDGQTPFNDSGTPWAVGNGITLDATVFDEGGEGISYSDADAEQLGSDFRDVGVDIVGNGDAIGWVDEGEWVEYTLDVAEAGTYSLSFMSSTPENGRTITASVEQAGAFYTSSSPLAVPNTGSWTNFTQTEALELGLQAGEQVLRLTFNGGSQDLASFTLVPVETNSAPQVDNGLSDLTATQDEAFSYTIPAEAFSDADGDALSYTASGLPAGLTLSPNGVISGTPTASGSFEVLVSASDGEDSVETGFTLVVGAPPVDDGQTPFNGTQAPWLVDAGGLTLQAIHYDAGGQGVAYNDSSEAQLGSNLRGDGVDIAVAENAIGWVADGEWVEYTINVAEAGTYDLSFMLSTPESGRSITASVEQGGTFYTSSSALAVPNTGSWTNFTQTQPLAMDLEAGEQVLRLTFNGGSMDIQSLTLDKQEEQQAFNDSGTPWLIDADGLTLDAVLYDEGGEGVAFSDSDMSESGDDFRADGVDTVGGGEAIGWVADGEWVEYTVNVEQAGTYALSFQTATTHNGRSITAAAEQDGQFYAESSLAVPNSGAWGNYVSTGTLSLDLEAGEQVLRLTFNGGSMDLQSFTIAQVPGAMPMLAATLDEPALNDASFDGGEHGEAAMAPMSDEVSLAGVKDDEGMASSLM
ncbi:carbohydrate-binding protein [Litchfieldella xinjiangensis]|uniref:carbohydrate-binding protein n=1 Tax=Litchfieldella xinjiangensis TaxID=1166948 RepID=UPI000693A2E5|nr:carbohydrate-binding protein [Halomonas xinjiangensis]